MTITKAQIRSFYDESREGAFGRHTDAFEQIGRRTAIVTLLTRAGVAQPLAIDVGCGAGWLANQAVSAVGGKWLGVDIAPRALREAARDFGSSTLRFAAMDGENLALGDEAVDLCVCSEVIEHMLSPSALLAELRRVIRSGGWVILTTPNPWAVQYRYQTAKVWIYRVVLRREMTVTRRQIIDRPITPPELDALVRGAGLRVVRRAGTHYFPPPIRGRIPLRGLAQRVSRLIERFNLLPYFGLYQVLLLRRVPGDR